MPGLYLGIDIGSTTIKLVTLDPDGALLERQYLRANGRPRETLLEASRRLAAAFPGEPILGVGLTGSGGRPVAEILGGVHTNELVTQTRALGAFHPEARTVIEIGGQDSKFLSVRWDESSRQMVLEDFAMNALCAAGTGSFLDQQAERLGISIDGEFARLALQSPSPARIAGRCTVFAKSDMIHLQQEGTPLADILMGLCHALARNFRSVIGKGKSFTPPVVFQGGVAFNGAVARAFAEVLGLEPGQLVIPHHHDVMAAIGAALVARDEETEGRHHPFRGFDTLEQAIRSGKGHERSLPILPRRACASCQATYDPPGGPPFPAYLGVDVGSISTNVVLIDEQNRVIARRYLPTAGRPLEAVRRGLREVGAEVGDRVRVQAVGCTGSGRHLTGHYVGADAVRNEITAQARAAVAVDPDVDTVFEIGGQDSKYIRLDRGAVVDFAMNNACAAGTGSFLEEQAERLRVEIRGEFAEKALSAPAPACLGERCTVFMESDLVHHQQRGAKVENLTAGLAYSIVQNYMNRVVNTRVVGRRVFFQGGVAYNAAVASAFERATGRPVVVPPNHDVTGAIGAAILAREELHARPGSVTRFRGFDASERGYHATAFVCRACPNLCEVKKIAIEGEAPLFYGARCDRFEVDTKRNGTDVLALVPDLFGERERLLLGAWTEPGPRVPGRVRIGMPRTLIFHDLFPYWRAFFDHLGMDLVLSSPTNAETVRLTAQTAAAETCWPVKLVFGHVVELAGKDVDWIFLPSILDREEPGPGQAHNHYCPFIPAAAPMVAAHVREGDHGIRYLTFPFHMQEREGHRGELAVLARKLGVSARRVRAAAVRGEEAQADFHTQIRARGREVLEKLGDGRTGVVIVGRPYNTCDLGVCQDLPRKLRKLGVLPIPIDFLGARRLDITDTHPDMFWRSGQEILGAARMVAADPRLQCIYLTSFQCGPDSFLLSYFRGAMRGKPFLELEVDDHTAEAGIVTRCEAFLDSLGIRREGSR